MSDRLHSFMLFKLANKAKGFANLRRNFGTWHPRRPLMTTLVLTIDHGATGMLYSMPRSMRIYIQMAKIMPHVHWEHRIPRSWSVICWKCQSAWPGHPEHCTWNISLAILWTPRFYMPPRTPIHHNLQFSTHFKLLHTRWGLTTWDLQLVSQQSTFSTPMVGSVHCHVNRPNAWCYQGLFCLPAWRAKQLLLLTLYAGRKSSAMASFMLDCSNVSGIVHCCCCSCKFCKPQASEQ